MKKLSVLLVVLMIMSLFTNSCNNPETPEMSSSVTEAAADTSSPETSAAETKTETSAQAATSEAAVTEKSVLDGKKVIFIGNSMIYYGGTVTKGNYRAKDTGWFYNICKANGDSVTVIDCTYGNHRLSDFTEAGCNTSGCDVGIGGDLLKGLDLASFDYVFISEAGNNNASIITDIKNIMARFTNPDTVFVYLCHAYSYYKGHTNITGNLSAMQKLGIVIVDWGHLVYDVYNGSAKVSGAEQKYTKNTFINSTSSDTHHPNPLSGYITSQMCYCAVTGKTAVGQDYSAKNKIQYGAGSVTYALYRSNYYTSGTSNFEDVFASAADMQGIQKLIDSYLNKWGVGNGKDIPKPAEVCSHVFDGGKDISAASVYLPGIKEFRCEKCGYTKTETVERLPGKTNLALGKTATVYSASKTGIGTGSKLTDGIIGNNGDVQTNGTWDSGGDADSFGGKLPKNGTKISVNTSSGTENYYYGVKIDLGTGCTVDGFAVYEHGYKTTVMDPGFDILVSEDGITWTKVYSASKAELFSGASDNKGYENYVNSTTATAKATDLPAYAAADITPVQNVRYVLYGCTAYREINGYYTARFNEIEVYGTK